MSAMNVRLGDTETKHENMWELNVRIEVTVEPLIIHLGESDDDSN
jgi:hypothetical protein